jgi:small redox-active disulfide protein 2
MIIKILGAGCPKCKQLESNTIKAVEQVGIDAQIEKITDIKDIMNYGVMATPALVIDEVVKSAGKLLSPDEIKNYLL